MYVLYHYILKEQSVYVNKESNYLIRLPPVQLGFLKLLEKLAVKYLPKATLKKYIFIKSSVFIQRTVTSSFQAT